MSAPGESTSGGAPVPSGREGARNARYSYLVGRLHNRQMTMEEATELFTLMQGMIQTSEAARLALMRTPPPPTAMARPAPLERPPAMAAGTGDDLLLVGLLAMGAGAGLLAAMTKRVQDATAPAGTTSSSRPDSDNASRKG